MISHNFTLTFTQSLHLTVKNPLNRIFPDKRVFLTILYSSVASVVPAAAATGVQ